LNNRQIIVAFVDDKIKKTYDELLNGSQLEILSIIIEWFDHKNYDRKFKY